MLAAKAISRLGVLALLLGSSLAFAQAAPGEVAADVHSGKTGILARTTGSTPTVGTVAGKFGVLRSRTGSPNLALLTATEAQTLLCYFDSVREADLRAVSSNSFHVNPA